MLIQAEDDEGLSTDELMLATGKDSRTLQNMLRELDRWRLLSNDIEIGVTLYREPDTAQRLIELARIEDALLASLREAAPTPTRKRANELAGAQRAPPVRHLRRDAEVDFGPDKLTRLLKSFAEPFGEGKAQRGFFALRPQSADSRYLKLLRGWQEIEIIRERRMRLARALVASSRAAGRAIRCWSPASRANSKPRCRPTPRWPISRSRNGTWPCLPRCSTWTPTRCCTSPAARRCSAPR